jgi:hypothetical protein
MVRERTLTFQGKGKDLTALGQAIAQDLKGQGYRVQSGPSPQGYVIQAAKAGILRDIITADRAFTILIAGTPEDFTIRVGIGKLVQNLAVAAVEALLLSELFLVVDVPEMLWTAHVETGLIERIRRLVESSPGSAQGVPLRSSGSGAPTTVK